MRESDFASLNDALILSQKDEESSDAKKDDAPADDKSANAVESGYLELAKQLTKMAESLPMIKACMADVKAGNYKNSAAGLAASGAATQSQTDPATGQPVQIVVKSTPYVA